MDLSKKRKTCERRRQRHDETEPLLSKKACSEAQQSSVSYKTQRLANFFKIFEFDSPKLDKVLLKKINKKIQRLLFHKVQQLCKTRSCPFHDIPLQNMMQKVKDMYYRHSTFQTGHYPHR